MFFSLSILLSWLECGCDDDWNKKSFLSTRWMLHAEVVEQDSGKEPGSLTL